MYVDWHRLAEMAAERHPHEQQCEVARRHPLFLVDNIKNYFTNYTRYFNARRNYVNKICMVQLVHYFGGRCRRIGVMTLSVMTQQRVIVDDVLKVVTSLPPCLQTWRIGILPPLPCIPLFHPFLAGAQTCLVDCCVFHWRLSYQCLFYLIFNIFSL